MIPVTELTTSEMTLARPQGAGDSDRGCSQVGTDLLDMPLREFQVAGLALEVKVPWLETTLWFVSSSGEVATLMNEGVSRGRIWTARELQDLLETPGLSSQGLQQLSRFKFELGVELVAVRKGARASEKPEERPERRANTENGWPLQIPGLGPQTFVPPFSTCTVPECSNGTFTRYGSRYLCRGHAWKALRNEGDQDAQRQP